MVGKPKTQGELLASSQKATRFRAERQSDYSNVNYLLLGYISEGNRQSSSCFEGKNNFKNRVRNLSRRKTNIAITKVLV